MNGWMDEWMCERMTGLLHEWMSEWINVWKNEWMNDRVDGWMNEWMNSSMNTPSLLYHMYFSAHNITPVADCGSTVVKVLVAVSIAAALIGNSH